KRAVSGAGADRGALAAVVCGPRSGRGPQDFRRHECVLGAVPDVPSVGARGSALLDRQPRLHPGPPTWNWDLPDAEFAPPFQPVPAGVRTARAAAGRTYG